MTDKLLFTGVCTALITPFDRGRIDFAALDRLIERQLEAGVQALLVAGTTGESSTLSEQEWRALVAHALLRINGRACVLAGTGSNNLRTTLSRARFAAQNGADAQLCVTPYYNKATQQGLHAYFTRIADAGILPVILYNVPARTGVNMQSDTCARLAHHPQIIGIKEAADDLSQLSRLLMQTRLPVYCGADALNAPALRLGACGVISVLSNLCPAALVSLCTAMDRGCVCTAMAYQQHLMPLIDALFCEVSPAPVKHALSLLGLCRQEVRLPLVPVQPQNAQRIKRLLAAEGMLAK